MCCFAEFLVKYVIFIANVVFSLAGLALIGVGTAVLLQLSEVREAIPVAALDAVPISIIVLGCIIFFVAFFGCCGAIRESCCMLSTYAICMALLAGVKIWLSTVIYSNLNNLSNLVSDWLTTAFNQSNREPFHLMEIALQCCGTTGAGSYNSALPPSCCAGGGAETGCSGEDSFGGCISRLTDYLDSFGSAIGIVIIIVIIVEMVACIFGIFLACRSSNKKTYG